MKFVVQDKNFQALLDMVMKFRDNKQIQNLKTATLRLYEEANKHHNIEVRNIAKYCLAEVYFYFNDMDNCFSACWELIEYYEDHEKDMIYMVTCNLLGLMYQAKTDLHNAVTYFFKGFQQAEIEQSREFEFKILNNIGGLFFDVECYDEALYYFMRVFQSIKQNHFSDEIYEVTLTNILVSYACKKDIQSAIEWENQYQEVFQNSKNFMGKLGYMSYKVIRDAYKHDIPSMKKSLDAFLEFSDQHWAGILTTTLVLEVIEACLSLNAFEEALLGFACIEKKMVKEDYKVRLKMTDLYVQMYKKRSNQAMLLHYLQEYYDCHRKLSEMDSQVEFHNLRSVVRLEEERHIKKKLMLKQAELSAKNEYDSFTGLLHKASFVEYVNAYFLKKRNEELAVFIIFDVDNFKGINDTFGHIFGDQALHALSEVLRRNMRENDIIGRIGGDEFSFVLKDIKNEETIHHKLQKILDEVNQIKLDGMKQGLSISIGGVVTKESLAYESLLQVADKALYQAKSKGKNTFVLIK